MRTIGLTEYRPRDVRLPRPVVDELQARWRTVMDVTPLPERGRYRLVCRGYVGSLVLAETRFQLRPKISNANLFYLIDPDAASASNRDLAATEPAAAALAFLGSALAQSMSASAAVGLRRGYAEQADRLPFLQGRLDVAEQLRHAATHRDQFSVTRDELTADLPFHRAVRATGEAFLLRSELSPPTRAGLISAIQGYADVRPVPLQPEALWGATEAERPLAELCQLIAAALAPQWGGGDMAVPAFLLDMSRVFERYIGRGLRQALGSRVTEQEGFCFHGPVPPDQPDLTARPDFVIRRDGKIVRILDAKWKALDGPPEAPDVHQALAYGIGLGCPEVGLVYPCRRSRHGPYPLASGLGRFTVHTVRVVGTAEQCRRSMNRLIRRVR